MCGIVGYLSTSKTASLEELELACKSLNHRGPDAMGVQMINPHLGFGHTRLSFLDLSNYGNQPMSTIDESVWISYNGEVYNFKEIREELENHHTFRGTSDTEVILAAYQCWGMAMLKKIKGMFAFAIYDKAQQKLFLVRDQFGIKPLYYHLKENTLIFGSELKALHQFKAFQAKIDYTSFCDYFVYRYVPSPKTIWEDTYKVPPAHYLQIDVQSFETELIEYWTLSAVNEDTSEADLITFTNNSLKNSITQHNRADVPVGSFLSGGYDSSAIVAYLKEQHQEPATFSIGFSEWEKSEDHFASIVAKHLSLPNKRIVADLASLNLIDKMPQVYDEPIADISIIPTFIVSQLASKDVKAVMSGEGADELFGGYHWQKEFYGLNNPVGFVNKIKRLFTKPDTLMFYANAMSMGSFDKDELKKMLHPKLHKHIPQDSYWFYKKHLRSDLSPLKRIQYLDMKCFMGELVLTKVDRASMANSLEVRVPFLDTTLFKTIFQTSEDLYYKKDITKYLLHENIKDKLPQEILDRNKQGFVGPDEYYMNKEWYRKQLEESVLVKCEIIRQEYIDSLLQKDYDWKIWKILVMEKWFRYWQAKLPMH